MTGARIDLDGPGPTWTRTVGLVAAAAVVVIGVSGSLAVRGYEQRVRDRALDDRIDLVADSAGDELSALLDTQFGATAATAAALSVDPGLDRASFARFAAGLHEQLPSLLGVGYVRRVPTAGLGELVAAARADGAPGFEITSAGPGPEHAILLFNEPSAELESSWGVDLTSTEPARVGLERATASGRTTVTERLVLAIDRDLPVDEQPAGYVTYAPVYRPGAATSTPAERRAALVGWSNVPFRAQDLLDEVSLPDGSHAVLRDGGRDGVPAAEIGLPPPATSRPVVRPVSAPGSGLDWYLEIGVAGSSVPGGDNRPTVALVAGLVLTAIVATLVIMLSRGSERWARAARRATRTLVESEQRLRATIEAAPDVLLVVDHDGTISSASARAHDLFGIVPDDLLGRSLTTLIPALEDIAGSPDDPDLEAVRADGSRVAVEVTARPLRHDDPSSPSVAIVRDVTARRQAREALAAYADELERSNRDLEEFATVAAHDLSEPLTVVGGYADLLLHRGAGAGLDQQSLSHLETISRAAKRMRSLLQAVLDMSRLRSETGPREQVALGDVVAAARANLELSLERSAATVTVGELPVVWGDRDQLLQVLQNLIGNAVRYRHPDRPLQIRIDAAHELGGWRVAVADNGIGIPEEHRERIFAMFRRLHGREEYDGLGVGLAVCRRVVELHGGRLWAEETPGGGATFAFTLPDAPAGDPVDRERA